MGLSLQDVQEYINTPSWVKVARDEHRKLDVHFNGIGVDAYLGQINGIENEQQFRLRKKYLTTNRYILANLTRPIDKIFSAKGGNRNLNIKSETLENKLRAKLSKLSGGLSVRKWISDIQANKSYTDPAGLVFFEWNDDLYPTIKSINNIRNYQKNGRLVDWVIFEPFKHDSVEGDIFRVVDEELDRLVVKNGDVIKELPEIDGIEQTFDNPFGMVPAVINSDKISSTLQYNESPFEVIVSLADKYLRTGSVKNLVEFLHGYPVFWRILTDCGRCSGSGMIDGENCPSCNGTGKALSKDITEMIQVERPMGDEQKITPDVAGYVAPPIESWREMREEMDWVYGLMELTIWGSRMTQTVESETATVGWLNVQPVNDRLNDFADGFENLEKLMIDIVGRFMVGEYEGAMVSYGRRFLVESPDAVLKKYHNSITTYTPNSIRDEILTEYIQGYYSSDLETQVILEKAMTVEPFPHNSIDEVLKFPIDEITKHKKVYFDEFWRNYPKQSKLVNDIKKINKDFIKFIESKNIENETTGQEV